jgi:D-glycero-alpha-D-manno-heptose-7-phosphate kinase
LKVDPLVLSASRKQELNDHLMLFFTGFSRFSSDIAKAQVANIATKGESLHRMRAMVDDGVSILCGGKDVRDFGDLLHSGWVHKRGLSDQVSNAGIDALYERGRWWRRLHAVVRGAGAAD